MILNNYKKDVYISNDCVRSWTSTAKHCLKLGCDCSKCYIYKSFESLRPKKCRMKYAVIELVKKFGLPDNMDEKYKND